MHMYLCTFKALGKTGKVLKVYGDGDLRVQVNGATWTINPMCCVPAPHTQQDANNTMSHNEREDHTSKPGLFTTCSRLLNRINACIINILVSYEVKNQRAIVKTLEDFNFNDKM